MSFVDMSIETKVVYAIADAEGVEPEELDMVLYDYVDLESIADLVDDDTTAWTFSFEILSYVVTVDSDGSVLVESQDETRLSSPRR